MATLVMVRTVCCESFKCGVRCSNCPCRPENQEAVRKCKSDLAAISLGRRLGGILPKRTQAVSAGG